MALYFFDTSDGDFVKDKIGIECRDLTAVHRAALIYLAHLSRDIIPIAVKREVAVVVRDEDDNLVTQLGVQLEVRLH